MASPTAHQLPSRAPSASDHAIYIPAEETRMLSTEIFDVDPRAFRRGGSIFSSPPRYNAQPLSNTKPYTLTPHLYIIPSDDNTGPGFFRVTGTVQVLCEDGVTPRDLTLNLDVAIIDKRKWRIPKLTPKEAATAASMVVGEWKKLEDGICKVNWEVQEKAVELLVWVAGKVSGHKVDPYIENLFQWWVKEVVEGLDFSG